MLRIIIRAVSSRMSDLQPRLTELLDALGSLQARTLVYVG